MEGGALLWTTTKVMVLFVRLGSGVSLVNEAVLVKGPEEDGAAVIVKLVEAPTDSVPTGQATFPPPKVHPGEAARKVTPAGIVSVTTTPDAGWGPALVTLMV